jgi:formamidopyrimidine-DNA glycosylase
MPELPDLVRVERVLSAAIAGRRVRAARTGDPTVLRIMVSEPFPANLVGRVLRGVERRGHFMRFAFDADLVLVVNAMLVGRYRLLPGSEAAREKDPAALGFALAFEDGPELRYIDDKRMGKVYVARAADESGIAVYGGLGVDLLSDSFDRDTFMALARARRDQVRMFLMDKRALASIGNAYADEILFAARIHPKTFVRQLTAGDLDRLFTAIGQTLRHAIDEIQRRDGPIDVKVRDFLAVRGRDGKPCPNCGTKIRSVRVGDGDACFCPVCQPATRRLFVDWGRLPPSAGAGAGTADTAAVTNGGADPAVPEVAEAVADGRARPRRRSRR